VTTAKNLADAVSPVAEAVFNAASALAAVFEVPTVDVAKITSFFANFRQMFDAFSAMADTVANDLQKRAARFGERLAPVVDAISGIVEPLKSLFEFKIVDPNKIVDFISQIGLITTQFGLLARSFGMEIVKEGARFAEPLQGIIGAIKSALEVAQGFANYQPVSDAALLNIKNDIQKLVDWASSLIALGESGIARFETLESVIARMAAAMSGAGTAIKSLATGTAAPSGSVGTQSYEASAGNYSRSGGGGISGSLNLTISLRELEEIVRLPNALERLEALFYNQHGRNGPQAVALQQA
jgi:hypothetical protein